MCSGAGKFENFFQYFRAPSRATPLKLALTLQSCHNKHFQFNLSIKGTQNSTIHGKNEKTKKRHDIHRRNEKSEINKRIRRSGDDDDDVEDGVDDDNDEKDNDDDDDDSSHLNTKLEEFGRSLPQGTKWKREFCSEKTDITQVDGDSLFNMCYACAYTITLPTQ